MQEALLVGAAPRLFWWGACDRLGLGPGRRSSPSAAAGAAPEGAAAPTATDGEERGRAFDGGWPFDESRFARLVV